MTFPKSSSASFSLFLVAHCCCCYLCTTQQVCGNMLGCKDCALPYACASAGLLRSWAPVAEVDQECAQGDFCAALKADRPADRLLGSSCPYRIKSKLSTGGDMERANCWLPTSFFALVVLSLLAAAAASALTHKLGAIDEGLLAPSSLLRAPLPLCSRF